MESKSNFSAIINKILINTIAITLLISTFSLIYAQDLTDIETHWGKSYIEYLINKGAVSRYPDGTFKPDNTITKAEFLKIALTTAQGGKFTQAQEGEHWAAGVFEDAYSKAIVTELAMPEETWNEPINRYEMAMIMVRITENILKESQASTKGVTNIMADYNEVSKQAAYKHYVEQAYMKGLITGVDTQGTFGGSKTGTRAESATMVTRLLDIPKRVKPDTTKVPVATEGREIIWNSPDKPEVPKAGDIFIKEDGTKETLQIGPSGVLGENQGLDLYSGITFQNGVVFKEGMLGTESMGYRGEPYKIDSKTGEGHFVSDWGKISEMQGREANKIENPKDGQTYGNWYYYTRGQWYWTGPTNGPGK